MAKARKSSFRTAEPSKRTEVSQGFTKAIKSVSARSTSRHAKTGTFTTKSARRSK